MIAKLGNGSILSEGICTKEDFFYFVAGVNSREKIDELFLSPFRIYLKTNYKASIDCFSPSMPKSCLNCEKICLIFFLLHPFNHPSS